ncbi:MAG: hypothetical protein CFK52_03355 [Chloracidobacterium sp. CP2_5A]|nr:MAG: hypothetical protein CFK52_03355 [Chloracidobacterium sp. CP2_5A]
MTLFHIRARGAFFASFLNRARFPAERSDDWVPRRRPLVGVGALSGGLAENETAARRSEASLGGAGLIDRAVA